MASKESEIKIEELCRTCLSKDITLNSIFDILYGKITIDFVVSSITGIKIHKDDGLPASICCECKEKATKAFDFKKMSEEAHISLQGIIKGEIKDWSLSSQIINPVNASGLKTEDVSAHEHDDYIDNDFSLPLTSGPDLNDLEPAKTENQTIKDKTCFACNKCLRVYKTIELYLSHVRTNCHDSVKTECDTLNGAYCPICGTCYDDAGTLSKHMSQYHTDVRIPKKRGRPKKKLTDTIPEKLSENRFHIEAVKECTLCKLYFKTKEEFGAHLLGHKDMKLLRCVLCKKMFMDKDKYDQHKCIEEKDSSNTESNEKKTISFLSELSLKEVMASNIDVDNVTVLHICGACGSIYLSEKDLINHHDAEHPELSQRCNLCTKVFASVRSAARHRAICKQIERKYKCSTCGLKFAYEISLNKHILRYHEGQSVSVKFIDTRTKRDDRQFQCDTCSRCFYKRDLLVKHTKIHMPNEKYFECDVCEKKFHRRDNLRSHMRVHDVERDKGSSSTSLCLYCGRSFSNSSNLIVHMRRHTGEKPYKCDFCGKGFPRSSDLQCHRRSHTGEKPCICRVCGKGFSRSNKLSRHMRVHTGQRPYKCTYCEKAFSQSNDLTLHIRRHTGDRPYICEVCGDRFIQGTALQNHRRAHGHFPPPPAELPTEPPPAVQTLSYTV